MDKIKYIKKNKGITLVALVVTIIVLLVLAGISLSLLLGTNGLLWNVERANSEYSINREIEQIKIAWSALSIQKGSDQSFEITSENLKQELEQNGNHIRSLDLIDGFFFIIFNDTGNEYKVDSITGEVFYLKNESLTEDDAIEYEPFVRGNDATAIEDFEDDNYCFEIVTDSSSGWFRTNESGYTVNDTYSFRSGHIGNNGVSTAEIKINIPDNGLDYYMDLDYMVSSENSDKLVIQRNASQILNVGGINKSSLNKIPLYTGENIINLKYQKDSSSSKGNDVVSVDNIHVYIKELTAPIVHFEKNSNYKVKVSISYPTISTRRYYSTDGENWHDYDRKLNVENGTKVYAKYDFNDEHSPIAEMLCYYNYGSEIEDFEDDNLIFDFTGDWIRSNDNFKGDIISGRYSYRSNKISHNQTSKATTTFEVPDDGTDYNLSFDYKTSSESSDKLIVKVNGITVLQFGGINSSNFTTPLISGSNTVEFIYSKDSSVDKNNDTVLIDNLKYSQSTLNPPVITYLNSQSGSNVDVTVTYNDLAFKKLYSIDEGNTWNDYNGTFTVPSGTVVYAKYVNGTNVESSVSSKTVTYLTGSNLEDFEHENMVFNFEGNWTRTRDNTNGNIIDGRYSFISAKIGANQSSSTKTYINVPEDGTDYYLKFDYRLSSELSDKLIVKLNNTTILSEGGSKKSSFETRLRSGSNTLEFIYSKDSSINKYNDVVLIDNLVYYQKSLMVPTISYVNSSSENNLDVSILYNKNAYKKYYSINEGDTWNEYNGTFTVPSGTVVYAKYSNVADEESGVVSLQVTYSYGSNIENFEDDDLIFNFEGNWFRDRDSAIKDKYSYRGAKIGSNGSTSTKLTVNAPDDGNNYVLYFDYMVSSESGYDWLKAVLNGNEVLKKSGNVTSFMELNLQPGINEIVFSYSKDSSGDKR